MVQKIQEGEGTSRIDKAREIAEDSGEESDFILLSPESYSKVATPKRRNIITTLREKQFSSQKELAEELDRDTKNVHEDLDVLRRHGVVEFEQKGRGKSPKLKHEYVVGEKI